MISSRLPPLVRTFFSPGTAVGRSERDAQGNGQQQGEPERDATEEEARRALQELTSTAEFQKNALSAELSMASGYPLILVRNDRGVLLRSLRGKEILRLLVARSPNDTTRSGRLLDRRI